MNVLVIQMPINERIGHTIFELNAQGFMVVHLGGGVIVVQYENQSQYTDIKSLLDELGFEYTIIEEYDSSYGMGFQFRELVNPQRD